MGYGKKENKVIEVDINEELSRQLLDNVHKEVHVKKFPRLGAETHDSPRIQRAIDSLGNSKGDVIFSEDFVLGGKINVPVGVNLFFRGGKVTRTHNKDVAAMAFDLQGNNIVTGIDYNGGSDSITVNGSDYIYYSDFDADQSIGTVTFLNCKFDKSCGSSVLSDSANIKVTGCTFGDFLDHAVYVGGRSWPATTSKQVIISGNTINAPTATRDAIKVRNGIDLFVVSNNVGSIPNGKFLELDTGDTTVAQRKNNNLSIIGNSINAKEFVAISTEDIGIENLIIDGNTGSFTGYVFKLGNFPSGGKQLGCAIKNGVISSNTFTTTGALGIINGDLIGMVENLNICDNVFAYNNSRMFYLLGNIKDLSLKGNTVKCNATYISTNRILDPTRTYPAYLPTIIGNIVVDNNTINGEVASILFEQTFGSDIDTAIKFNSVFRDNIMTGSGVKSIVNVFGNFQTNIATSCHVIDNITIGSKTANVYKSGLIFEESHSQKVLRSPNGTNYRITVNDAGTISATVF